VDQSGFDHHHVSFQMTISGTTSRAILIRAAGALAALLSAAHAAQAAERLESGKWESVIVADGQARTIAYCITQDEAASINGDSRTARAFAEKKAQKATEPCTFKSYEVSGDTVSYTMVCGTRTINDKTVYHGHTAEGTKTITKEGQTVSMQISSQRVGKSCL
jgi:hypothetical protein